jgi:hypothetical protein
MNPITKGEFGYKVCADLRTREEPAGKYAFEHWLNYQKEVARHAE